MRASISFRFFIAFLMLVVMPMIASAQTVSIDPASQASPEAGKTIKVSVKVSDVKQLFGYQFDTTYDPTALKFKSAAEGDFLKAGGAPTFFNPPKDDGKGTVKGAAATRLAKPGVDGTGVIATLEFEIVAVKESKVDLANVKLSDPDAKAIANVKTAGGTVTAAAANKPPVANAGKDLTGDVGAAVNFDASASKDEDGKIASYDWDFGDTKKEKTDKPTISHAYEKDGKYTVKLTVTDDKGATAEASISVTISLKLAVPITEYKAGMPYLAFSAVYEAAAEGSAYVTIWKGDFKIEKGMSLEYQIAIISGNPNFKAGVDLQASDGTRLSSIKEAVDQNSISASASADLSKNANFSGKTLTTAYHRKISLDALAGKSLAVAMVGTEGGKALVADGTTIQLFNAYVANIQVTTAAGVVLSVYKEGDIQSSKAKESSDTAAGGVKGMANAKVAVLGAISVEPAGKLTTTWGKMKKQ